MGLRYATTTNAVGGGSGTMNASCWTPKGYAPAIAHVFHDSYWGNWQFKVGTIENDGKKSSNASSRLEGQISFAKGGWQEARGGRTLNQPFFIEGVKEALDVAGE